MIGALLRKDLRVLRRSPALLALIVVYPLLIAIGLGLALTRDPQPPKVAIVNLLPKDGGDVTIAGQKLSIADLSTSIAGGDVKSLNVATRQEAVRMIDAGTIDGALVIPEDAAEKLRSSLTSGGVSKGPQLEVLYRSSGPLDGTLVRSLIASRLRIAERALAAEIVRVATGFLQILREGGSIEILGQEISVLGLKAAEVIVADAARTAPANRKSGLEQAAKFASLARENLDLSDDVLSSVAKPLDVRETAIGQREGRSLSGFAVGVAAALSLMLVAMTLGAGLLAGEREEGTLRRLLRGGRGAWQIATAKALAAGLVAALSGLLLLAGLATLGATSWSGLPFWLPATALGGLAFAGFGVLLGAVLRDARAATLAAILLAVPVAVIALIPPQSIGGAASDVLGVVSAVLPFAPARELLDAAVASDPDWLSGGQLLAQLAGYTAIAGLLVRRGRA
ncbi:MAG: ABC transporter permease [Solirubrobacteraceae bacterium]|nr:ABC transporter permease [Solirubrobacteraceae bacterium]